MSLLLVKFYFWYLRLQENNKEKTPRVPTEDFSCTKAFLSERLSRSPIKSRQSEKDPNCTLKRILIAEILLDTEKKYLESRI